MGDYDANKKLLIALGGNAIVKPGQVGNIKEQFENTGETARYLVELIKDGYQLTITHGNGPQVGNILRRSELAKDYVYPIPLGICVADSQGGMGYMISQVFENEMIKQNIQKKVYTIITNVIVYKNDPAFKNPTKPIGHFYTEERARELIKENGWVMREDKARGGWRRVVPSPEPKEIVEIELIKRFAAEGEILIAGGGGGIPVVREDDGTVHGIDAVIDKDLTSALIAASIGVKTFFILTGVEKVCINFATPDEKNLDNITVDEALKYYNEGQFPDGSMGPKIKAAINFLRLSDNEDAKVIITDIHCVKSALEGKTGTHITR